mmetsp:Transcript_44930/g.113752  ORF Transcript_44930/g.113752 Transcript_44930/m.113752 type:complete len:202 (-) Transcript_44930:100-705(-)
MARVSGCGRVQLCWPASRQIPGAHRAQNLLRASARSWQATARDAGAPCSSRPRQRWRRRRVGEHFNAEHEGRLFTRVEQPRLGRGHTHHTLVLAAEREADVDARGPRRLDVRVELLQAAGERCGATVLGDRVERCARLTQCIHKVERRAKCGLPQLGARRGQRGAGTIGNPLLGHIGQLVTQPLHNVQPRQACHRLARVRT